MATKKANAEKEVKAPKAAPKAKAPKAAKPKAEPKPKAAPAPQLSKEDIQAAVYAAVKAAVSEVKAAEPKPVVPEGKPEPKKEVKKIGKSSDEKLMTALAIIYLVLGVLAIVAVIVGGFIADGYRDEYVEGLNVGLICIGAGVLMILPVLVQYAFMKLFANISYRLSSMDKK